MGPQFYLEPTVLSYKWTQLRKVKLNLQSLRTTVFKEWNMLCLHELCFKLPKVCGVTLKSECKLREKEDMSESSDQKCESFIHSALLL